MDDEVISIGRVSRYIRIAKAIIRALRRAGVPKFFSRYSNRVYDAWKHLILLALRQLEGKSYRRFIEWLGSCRPILRLLDLRWMPLHDAPEVRGEGPFRPAGQGSEGLRI